MVEFLNFFKVFTKTLKFHNFANNRPIFIWFVLNDVFYRVLHLFFCIKVEFMKNKTSLGGPSCAVLPSRLPASRSPDHPCRLRTLKIFKVRSKN
jgi:hypothetical protein